MEDSRARHLPDNSPKKVSLIYEVCEVIPWDFYGYVVALMLAWIFPRRVIIPTQVHRHE